uniref:Uncharacterized protein n=1 Tax=Cannabis sativa TaxID=3483 RepID=A0A803QYC3_CANSA
MLVEGLIHSSAPSSDKQKIIDDRKFCSELSSIDQSYEAKARTCDTRGVFLFHTKLFLAFQSSQQNHGS